MSCFTISEILNIKPPLGLQFSDFWRFRIDGDNLILEHKMPDDTYLETNRWIPPATGCFNFQISSTGTGTNNLIELRHDATALWQFEIPSTELNRWSLCPVSPILSLTAFNRNNTVVTEPWQIFLPDGQLNTQPLGNITLTYVPNEQRFQVFDYVTIAQHLEIDASTQYELNLTGITVSDNAAASDTLEIEFLIIYRVDGFSDVNVRDYLKTGYTGYYFNQGQLPVQTVSQFNMTPTRLNDWTDLYSNQLFPSTYRSAATAIPARIYFRVSVSVGGSPEISDDYSYTLNFSINATSTLDPPGTAAIPVTRVYPVNQDNVWPTINLSTPTTVALDNDDFAEIEFGGSDIFRFYGTSYDRCFISSNGFLQFGSGDAGATLNLYQAFDAPRILFFWSRLLQVVDLTQVEYEKLDTPDRLVIHFTDADFNYCQQYGVRLNQIEIVLHLNSSNATGKIELIYGRLWQHPQLVTIVGVTPGPGVPNPIRQTGLATIDGSFTVSTDYVIEEFTSNDATHPLTSTHLTLVGEP